MIAAAANRSARPGIDHVERQRHMRLDRRMQDRGRVPGAVAHARHRLAESARGGKRQRVAVACDHVAALRLAPDMDFDAFEGGIHIARRAADRAFLAEHMPRLQAPAGSRRRRPACSIFPQTGKRNSKCGSNQSSLMGKPAALRSSMTLRKSAHTKCGNMNRSCKRGAPADQRSPVGLLPEPRDERPHEQLLREAHPGVRRHLERAELDEPQPACRAIG